MGHHEFCLFCTVGYSSWPTSLRHKSDFTDNDFAEELLAANSHLSLPGPSEIVDILKDLFEELSTYDNMATWLPEGGPARTVILQNIAIGHWDDDGDGIYQTIGDRIVVPMGHNVQVHIVDDPSSSSAHFSRIFCAETRLCIKEHASLCCNAYGEDSACFAMHESCYHYSRSWLEPHLLPPPTRTANPPLTFGEELYDISIPAPKSESSTRGIYPVSTTESQQQGWKTSIKITSPTCVVKEVKELPKPFLRVSEDTSLSLPSIRLNNL